MPEERLPRLSERALGELGARVRVPDYSRADLSVGIVHIGAGAFHRAHQARYLDEYFRRSGDQRWAICDAGLLAGDQVLRDRMVAQDCLYTHIAKAAAGERDEAIVGSVVEYLWADSDRERLMDRLAAPETKIVSLTITEGGYSIRADSGEFEATPAVLADLRKDAPPHTVFGVLTHALLRRRACGADPFTVVSCDNIQRNGEVARLALATFADLMQPGFGEWIRDHVAFPASMVDRITPAATDGDVAELEARLGYLDRCPVVCESFTQWVVEDNFPSGRPALEDVGVQFVADAEPYERLKLSMLNGSHQVIGFLGSAAGYEVVHEAVADPELRRAVRAYMEEARAALGDLPGVDVVSYGDDIVQRFHNEAIVDPLERLCAFASDRIPKFVLPVVRANAGSPVRIRMCALTVACWAWSWQRRVEGGTTAKGLDNRAAELAAAAGSLRDDPAFFLRANEEVFGEVVDDADFVALFRVAFRALATGDVRSAVRSLLDVAPSELGESMRPREERTR